MCPSSRPCSISMLMTLLVMKILFRSSPRTSMLFQMTKKRGRPGFGYWVILVRGQRECLRFWVLRLRQTDKTWLVNIAVCDESWGLEPGMTIRSHALGLASYSGQFKPWFTQRRWPRSMSGVVRVGGHRLELDRRRESYACGDTFVVKTNIHYPTGREFAGRQSGGRFNTCSAVWRRCGVRSVGVRSPSPLTCWPLVSGPSTRPTGRRKHMAGAAAACLSYVAEIDSQGVGPKCGNCSRGRMLAWWPH